jgi:hypothetical protein
MPWKCPECQRIIDHLDYNVSTRDTEYGHASLVEERPEIREESDELRDSQIIEEHEYNDSGGSEWDGDCDYECPECEAEINPTELLWSDEIEIPILPIASTTTAQLRQTYYINPNIHRTPPPPEFEEEDHQIVFNETRIQITDNPKSIEESSILCKKCFHLFVFSCDNNYRSYNDYFCECPKCRTGNSVNEFRQLLKDGYYQKNAPKKTTCRSV